MVDQDSSQPTTQPAGLRNRHIAMIALGGIIGAGLFVGSSAAIAATGPAVLLAFLAVGILVILVMRMLGEMVTADPGRGSFVEYIRAAHGDRLGFTAGWLYWFFWVVVLGSEAIAGAILLQDWIALPVWVLSIALIIVLKLVNFAAPRVFGECEFWLSMIKVISIVAFIGAALLYVFHVFGPGVPVRENVLGHGGFFPHGFVAVLSIIPTILFTMMGSEIATVAAAESPEPGRNVARVTRSIGTRVTLFYLASVAMILMVVPWPSVVPGRSPFVAAMDVMGVPGAGLLMRIVVLSAVLSCLNSSMYITSRILTELAGSGDAPAVLARTSTTQTPRLAITVSSIAGTLVAFSSILAPNTIFAFLLSCSGGVILMVYCLIVSAYVQARSKAEKTGQGEGFNLPLFPFCNYGTLLAVAFVFIAMMFNPEERMTAIASLGTSVFFFLLASFRNRRV
ncbi:amino acid permease [Acetobacter persici]|uniref:GABA permease n=1 Tax=Acetobacter persici TaxID=1076596 RepID=A0A6V8I5Y5_9PROT|nr:amino acid permease [Acetobacter persici]OUI92097.1 GABA permease [Acetobacter persici]GFE92036.1 GABA permease [Acetobacter persici]